MRYIYSNNNFPIVIRSRRRYGFLHFLWDVFMIFITCGIWLIWIFIREMRDRY